MSAPLFEVGKEYRTVGGTIRRVLCTDRPDTLRPIVTMDMTLGGLRLHEPNGSALGDSDSDLLPPDEVRFVHADVFSMHAGLEFYGEGPFVKVTYRAGKPISAEIVTGDAP